MAVLRLFLKIHEKLLIQIYENDGGTEFLAKAAHIQGKMVHHGRFFKEKQKRPHSSRFRTIIGDFWKLVNKDELK